MIARQRLFVMLPILLIAAWLAVFGDKTPTASQEIAQALAPRADPAEPPRESVSEEQPLVSSDDAGAVLRLRDRSYLEELAGAPAQDIFLAYAGGSEPVQPSEALPTEAQPFVLIGRMYDRGRWLAFLDREGKTYPVQVSDLVDGFRIDAVTAQGVRLTLLKDQSKYVIEMLKNGVSADD